MFDQVTPALVAVIVAIIAAVGGYLAAQTRSLKEQARDKIEKTVPSDWHWALDAAAELAVKAAYQIGGSNSDKFIKAREFVYSYLATFGIKVSENEKALIQAAIEAAYYDFKRQLENEAKLAEYAANSAQIG